MKYLVLLGELLKWVVFRECFDCCQVRLMALEDGIGGLGAGAAHMWSQDEIHCHKLMI